MKFIKGFTFRLNKSKTHEFYSKETIASLQMLKDCTSMDTVIIAIGALQDHPHSETIDYIGAHMPTDEDLELIISKARDMGLRVILKPMLNCRNGVWRAYINFFDLEVPCEPKWSNWFASYQDYLLHYAKLANRTGCEMLIIGCELVQTERKEQYWRSLVKEIREVYQGLLTYNTDKYQETEVKWWDCVDVISSSGYYPVNEWEENLDRIERVVKSFKKPFFFAECGCPCRTGASNIPNDWTYEGPLNVEEQAKYYHVMFEACSKREWVEGVVCWDWISNYKEYPILNDGYSVYEKPSSKVIQHFYESKNKIK